MNVKRFILLVACDLSSTQQQNEITRQTGNFAAFNITYEVWSAAKIRNKLRPHPPIVFTYLPNPDHWARVICGVTLPVLAPADEQETRRTVAVEVALLDRVEQLESGEAERQLESMRTVWREGRREEAIRLLESLKNDARWGTLSPRTRAKLLRFEAGARLEETGDIELAIRLADEAKRLSPSDDEARVRSLIARSESGPGAAAALLAGRNDVEALNLRASFLLEQGHIKECREVMEAFDYGDAEPNAETEQIRALVYVLDKEVDKARLEAQKALEREPRWVGTRFTAATIDYLSTISQATLPNQLTGWPEPIDWIVVKRDEDSLRRLREAANVFRKLSEETTDSEERRRFEIWLLACLANDPERQEEAVTYCRRLLESNRTNLRAIMWAIARGFDVDLKPSEDALKRLVDNRDADVLQVLTLAGYYFAERRVDTAVELLEATKPIFDQRDEGLLWTFWHAQALALSGNPQTASAELDASEVEGGCDGLEPWCFAPWLRRPVTGIH